MNTVIVFEFVTIYTEPAAAKTQAEFVKHESHVGLTVDQLKQLHKLCKEAVKATEVKPEPAV
jgi:hypothetical protein